MRRNRWYYFPKMQMDEVFLFRQFESDTALPGRMTFHTAFVDPTVRPDAPERLSIECSAFLFFPDFVAQHLFSFAFRYSGEGGCFSRRAWHVGPLEGSASCQSGCETTCTPKYSSDACS